MTETTDDLRPWDRQPGETSKAYALFRVFLDMGQDRTLQKVADQVSKSAQYIRRLSTQHAWQSRSASWDSMPARAVQTAYEDMAQEIARQHNDLATKLMERLSRNLDLMPEGEDPTIRWSTAQAAAHRSHSFATDLSKPMNTAREEIKEQIGALLARLAGDE